MPPAMRHLGYTHLCALCVSAVNYFGKVIMPIRHATLHQLKIFATVAEHQSFARAAQALHLTPAALSIQVRQLAEAAGQPLFEQIGKRIHLTEAGRVVLAGAREILQRLDQTADELAALQGLERGILRLAILTTAKYFIPRHLGRLCARYPGIEASLFVGNREALLERLAQNQDDLYILGQPPEKIRVHAEPFAENRLVAIAPFGHPLAGEQMISMVELAAEPLLFREEGSGTRLACEAFFARAGVHPRPRMVLGSNEAIKQSVVGGLGLAILSEDTVRAELARGELIILNVQGLPLVRQWHVVWPEGKHLSPAGKAFLNELGRTCD